MRCKIGVLQVPVLVAAVLLGQRCAPAAITSAPVPQSPYADPAALVPETPLDKLVANRLTALKITPAQPCSNAIFVRRVFLDVIGTLPTAAETTAFLQDASPQKRSNLIDRLLERDEFADYWALRWSNLLRVKSEFPINLWPNAVQEYHRWIRTSIKENLPYDQFVRELLTASGSNFRKPQVNFYRAVQSKDPATLAQAVALTFMGVRADQWPKARLADMAVFFSRVGYKTTAEWKEEIVYFDLSKSATPPSAVFPDGTTAQLSPEQDPRVVFADWLIRPTNAWFTRNIANRTWAWLLGRGIIHEPDDIRPDNPPVNPELLALLERECIASHYDLKHMFRLILNSQTYQRSCLPPSADPQAAANFAFYPVRRLEAEVLIDAIDRITGATEKYTSRIPEPFTFIPEEKPSIALADGSITSPFLDLFGRSPRNTGTEAEQRSNLPSSAQQLHLLNSSHIRHKLEQSAALHPLLQASGTPRQMATTLYLTILSRDPTADELRIFMEYNQSAAGRKRAGMDLAWALLNSAEFQFRH